MANPRPKKKVTQHGRTRVNLRLPADLDRWVKAYAQENNTTLTQIVVDYLTDLRRRSETVEVEQF